MTKLFLTFTQWLALSGELRSYLATYPYNENLRMSPEYAGLGVAGTTTCQGNPRVVTLMFKDPARALLFKLTYL